MELSQIFTANPLHQRPRRKFLKEELNHLTSHDQALFEQFGQGPIVTPAYSFIHHAIEDYAFRLPNTIACIYEGESITYKELNDSAEKVAQLLTLHGVQSGDRIALFLQRSIPMVIGILGILKVGAAYVPQDSRITPKTQLAHVLKMTDAKMVFTLSHLFETMPDELTQRCIALDDFLKNQEMLAVSEMDIKRRRLKPDNDDICFVLFTSGTTGMPNGVQVTHKNVCNILLTDPGSLGMCPGLKVSQILNIAFDMAAWEILGALSHGATLVIRGKDIQATAEKVDIIIATPSILGSINADECKNVKFVAVAGEPCPQPLADRWSEFCTFYNSCGPTEVTIVNTMQDYQGVGSKLTIGVPTPNNTVYILDENLKACAIGEIGEMWGGGDCVSAGYLKNDSLTIERYKPDPFLANGRMMFRTRDLGRWTADGQLEHFGRTDDQVKIRGFRVELDAVSGALESVDGCKQAVTLKLDSRNLVAFVRPSTVDIEVAKQMVAVKLPYYCVPSLVIAVDEFPMSSRGKIDKRALTVAAVKIQEKEIKDLTSSATNPEAAV